MNYWMGAVSLMAFLARQLVCVTDMFFLTVGRPALRLASSSAGTEVMGFYYMFGDARMPIWGVAAILCNLLLVVVSNGEQRWFYLASWMEPCAVLGERRVPTFAAGKLIFGYVPTTSATVLPMSSFTGVARKEWTIFPA